MVMTIIVMMLMTMMLMLTMMMIMDIMMIIVNHIPHGHALFQCIMQLSVDVVRGAHS